MNEVSINIHNLDWREAKGYPEGTLEKSLHGNSDEIPRSSVLKFKPGWEMEAYTHIFTEIHYVLEGEHENQD